MERISAKLTDRLNGIRMFPTNPEINYRLGVLYAFGGRYQEAYQKLDLARRYDADNASILMSEFTLLAQNAQQLRPLQRELLLLAKRDVESIQAQHCALQQALPRHRAAGPAL